MKKRLLKLVKIGTVVFAILLAVLLAVIIWSEYDNAVVVKYVRNENLPTIKADWKGTPVDQKNRFVNHEFPFLPSTVELLRWQLGRNPFKEEKLQDTSRLEVLDPANFLNSEDDGILWLGHAGFLIRLEKVNIIVDAAFGKPPFVRTYLDVPSPLDKIRQIDYVLISHDHRDHCDEATVRQLTGKFPNAKLLTGLAMEDLLNEWKTPSNEVQTAGWYQQFALPDERVKIFFLPTRHWSRRGLFDTNQRLWGAFVIQGAGKTIYFSSDTGYGNHYKELAEIFPNIDYFIIGIGAYEPRWFMKANHLSPEEAFQAFVDSKADTLIPMHFGRFDLSDEPPNQPLRILRGKAKEMNLSDKIKALQIYESIVLSD